MGDIAQLLFTLAGIALVWIFVKWRFDPLYHIPSMGPSLPLLSYWGAYKYSRNAPEILKEGYAKYKVFRIPMLDQWAVIVSGPEMNEELRRVPDTHVSFMGAVEELVQTRHTIAPDVQEHQIHIPVIRGQLTRNLNVVFDDVVDEIHTAFKDVISVEGDDWTNINLRMAMASIVARASNRVFVGLPLCRDPEYLSTVVNFALDVMKGRGVLSWVPKMFKDFVGPLMPWSKRAIRRASVFLRPIIEERQRKLQELGEDWNDKPNDFLMWLIEEATKEGHSSVNLIVQGVLVSNFAAIHTSSNSITHALYHLAAKPEYIQPLREEVEAVIKQNGWTKIAIGKLWKLDSFMRESQRLNGITAITVMRKVLQDITLSDGTYLPRGTLVAAAACATHYDGEYYKRPEEFSPFRFSDMRGEEGERIKHQYVSTSPEYVAFGHGKHACPGRFFAVNELKVMMAYILLNYDVMFEGGAGRPKNKSNWNSVGPEPTAKVMFKKRPVTSA